MDEPGVCPRPGCTCALEAEERTCSAHCAAAAEQLAMESPCRCGHEACGAPPGAAAGEA